MSVNRDNHGLSPFARQSRMNNMASTTLKLTVQNAARVFVENVTSVGVPIGEAEKAVAAELIRTAKMYDPDLR